jgi:hypothetical protein
MTRMPAAARTKTDFLEKSVKIRAAKHPPNPRSHKKT